jgi:hypothetical protein
MTITSNIFFGITAWTPSTSYSIGNRRSNGGNAYQCTKTGTSASSGGPAGTGASIVDGTATWKYLAHVDYITLSSWASGIPGALTQPILGLLWDCGPITTTAGTAYLTLSGHTTSPTNTITLKPAPGEGIRDLLAAGVTPLAFNANQGVRFVLPNALGSINYFVINDNNVIIEGLQVQDPLSTSNSSLLATRSPGSLILRDCIFDGYPQSGGAGIVDAAALLTCYNCLFIDRTTTEIFDSRICSFYNSAANSRFVNCTFVSIAAPTTAGDGAVGSSVSGGVIKNCAFFGYNPVVNSGSSVALAFDHCGFSKASPIGGLSTDAGGNIFSLNASSQFANSTSDFRLKTGASLINKGALDVTDIPTGDDIAGRQRIQWDIGAWAYFISANTAGSFSAPWDPAFSTDFGAGTGSALPFETVRAVGVAALTAPTNVARAAVSITIRASGAISSNRAASSATTLLFLRSSSVLTQSNGSTTGSGPWSIDFSTDFGPIATNALTVNLLAIITEFSPVAIVVLAQPASDISSFFAISSVASASVLNATSTVTLISLSASGFADQLGTSSSSLMTLSCVAAAVPLLQFSGRANIDWMAVVAPLTSAKTSSARANIFLVAASAFLGQRSLTSGSANIDLSASGSIGSSASTAITILPLSAVSIIVVQCLALGLASIDVISVQKPTPPLLESDAVTPLVIAADAFGFLLAADIIVPNLTSTTFGSGLATVPALSCASRAFLQIFFSGTEALAFTATAQAQQFDSASARVAIPVIRVAATSVQRGGATGLASFERLVASAQVGQVDAASALATIPALLSSGTAQGFAKASGGASVGISVNGLALTSGTAIARAVAFPLVASGTASFVLGALGSAPIVLSTAAQLAQVNSLSGLGAIQIAGIGTAALGLPASVSSTIPTLSAVGTATQTAPAMGTGVIPTVSASGAAVNIVEVARGSAVFMSLTSSVTAEINGTSMSAIASIVFSGGGVMMSEIEANVLVELEQIVAAHARIWTTPIGYEQGDVVVYWND